MWWKDSHLHIRKRFQLIRLYRTWSPGSAICHLVSTLFCSPPQVSGVVTSAGTNPFLVLAAAAQSAAAVHAAAANQAAPAAATEDAENDEDDCMDEDDDEDEEGV